LRTQTWIVRFVKTNRQHVAPDDNAGRIILLLVAVETERAMAAYDFDDHNIKWNKLGDCEPFLFSILNVDETNHAQGEHRRYEPDGEVRAHI
jgi:hypothetical protein